MQLSQFLFNIKSCSLEENHNLLDEFNEIIKKLNIHNIFNPSFFCDNQKLIFSFRAIPDRQENLLSYVCVKDKNGLQIKNISTEFFDELNGIRMIDPKVTILNHEAYVTFNSGWYREGNDIFIMKIYPRFESPKKIVYDNRNTHERNWGFFSEKGEIYAIYWINPIKVLRLKKRNQDSWEMEDHYISNNSFERLSEALTMGTQPSYMNGRYYFIAHKKITIWGKKLYLGKLCVLDFEGKTLDFGNYWLTHSLKSIIGTRIKHNTNLFSCTYFSGIQASNNRINLGYGINDVDYGFSSHNPLEL